MIKKIFKAFFALIFFAALCLIIIFFYMDFANLEKIAIDKTYVINLDRSVNRFAQMQKKLENYPFKYERFSAINGLNIKFTDLSNNKVFTGEEALDNKIIFDGNYLAHCNDQTSINITNLNLKEFHKRIPGEIGLICSDYLVLQDAIKNNYENIMIFEDDIVLRPHFYLVFNQALKYVPKNYDILYLSYKTFKHSFVNENDKYSISAIKDYLKHIFWRSTNKLMGSQALILSNNGIKKMNQCLEKYTKQLYIPIDVIQLKCLTEEKLKAYALTPKSVWFDHSYSNISDITLLKEIDKN